MLLDSDFDFGDFVTSAALFALGIAALIAIFVLGLLVLYSWEAESLMRRSFWPSSSSPSGGSL